MKTVSLESLLGAMQKAEANWQADEGFATYTPLTPDEFATLRRGEKVTIVIWYETLVNREKRRYALKSEVYRATVTKTRQYGYTDLSGLWVHDAEPTERVRSDLAALGHRVGTLIPSWTVNYKTVEGYSNIMRTADMPRTQVYRGWEVQVTPTSPAKE